MKNSLLLEIRERMRSIIKSSRFEYSSPRFDTSDVLQESIIQVANQVDLSQEETPVCQSWLKAVAMGHLAKLLRFNNAAKRSVQREKGDTHFMDLDSATHDPMRKSSEQELATLALRSLADLESTQRKIVEMRFFQQATYRQIAGELNMTIYAVKLELLKTLEQMRGKIDTTYAASV